MQPWVMRPWRSTWVASTMTIEDAAFFCENPNTDRRERLVLRKEWPRSLEPRGRVHMHTVEVERHGDGLKYSYYRHRAWGRKPRLTLLILLWRLIERARELMGVGR